MPRAPRVASARHAPNAIGSVAAPVATCALGLALALALLTSCRSPTQIRIDVTTDVPCDAVRGATIAVGTLDHLESKTPSAWRASCEGGRIGALVVVPSGAKDQEVAIRVVVGVNRAPGECKPPDYGAGCIVARRALEFLPHTSLELPVLMQHDCEGIVCPYDQTCVKGGVCVAAHVPDPSTCATPEGCNETVLTPPDGGAPDATSSEGGMRDGGDASDSAVASDACRGTCPAQVAAGRGFSCALTSGQVLCWGDNTSNQLGRGASTGGPATPGAIISPPTSPTGLIADTYAACIQTAAGDFHCWGFQIGLDAFGRIATPADLVGTPQRVFTSSTRAVALTNSKTAYAASSNGVSAAGDNTFGQLGVGDTLPHASLVSVMLPQGEVLGIGMTGDGACALLRIRGGTEVWCWGSNGHGEVDVNDFSNSISSPRKKDLSQFPAVVDIGSCQDGCAHMCALLTDTSIICWGSNSDGQLGRIDSSNAPARVVSASNGMPLKGVSKLALGYAFSCALVGDKVACWGSGAGGQLGRGGTPDGGPAPATSADFVVGLDHVTSLATGVEHACAVVNGTDVSCWGNNVNGCVGSPNVGQLIATPFHVLP